MVWAPVIHNMNPVSGKDVLLVIHIYHMGSQCRGTRGEKTSENFMLNSNIVCYWNLEKCASLCQTRDYTGLLFSDYEASNCIFSEHHLSFIQKTYSVGLQISQTQFLLKNSFQLFTTRTFVLEMLKNVSPIFFF